MQVIRMELLEHGSKVKVKNRPRYSNVIYEMLYSGPPGPRLTRVYTLSSSLQSREVPRRNP